MAELEKERVGVDYRVRGLKSEALEKRKLCRSGRSGKSST